MERSGTSFVTISSSFERYATGADGFFALYPLRKGTTLFPMPPLFHLSFPVSNILQTKAFYVTGLGCGVGRENPESVILDLYGHQLVAHVVHEPLTPQKGIYPRHFGLIFTVEADWEALLERSYQKELTFYQQAKDRFPGLPLEHRTFFLQDPFYNLMEFKFYRYPEAIFGSRGFTQVGDAVSV